MWFFLLVLVIYSAWYFAGVARVPFHPDESTYLYMSDEAARILRDPTSVFWQEQPTDGKRQMYRLLNPPVIHHVLAVGRVIAGLPSLPVDWDWSKTWQENAAAGALPSENLLLAGRMAAAALTPLSLLLLYLCGRQLAGDACGWTAAVLLAIHALVLLHTRHAMAEGTMVFTMLLCLWLFSRRSLTRPSGIGFSVLCGAAAGLAFCAKHSLLALAPVGLLAVLWGAGSLLSWVRLRAAAAYGLGFALVFALLNPVAWNAPVTVAMAMVRARADLAALQVQGDTAHAIHTPADRLIGAMAQVFFAPPKFAELANYMEETRAQEVAYLANPLHNLMRSLTGGAVVLIWTMFGFTLACLQAIRKRASLPLLVWIAASLLQTALLLATVPLVWQRYYLALVVFSCLWCGYGAAALWNARQARTAAPTAALDQTG